MPNINSKEELFKIAGRKKGSIEIKGSTLELTEMSVEDRFDFVDYARANKSDLSICYAFLVSRCCPALNGTSPEEIKSELGSDVLASAAIKVQELSGLLGDSKKKPLPKKKSSSTD